MSVSKTDLLIVGLSYNIFVCHSARSKSNFYTINYFYLRGKMSEMEVTESGNDGSNDLCELG